MPKFAKTAHLCNPRPGSKRLRRSFPACDACSRRLRGFRREACRSAARSKSQLLSPAPLLPSQPSFCTFSITSFVTSPLLSWSCKPCVHDSAFGAALLSLRPADRPTCAVSGRGGSAFRGGARRRQSATARARRFVAMGTGLVKRLHGRDGLWLCCVHV